MISPGMMNTGSFSNERLKILDLCHHIYKFAEEIYQTLSSQHQEQRDISRMWGELAIDKCNHADAYKMAGKLKGAGLREISGTPESATKFLEKMKQAVRTVRQTPLPLDDAFRFSTRMEEWLIPVHIHNIAHFYRDQDRIMLTSSLKKSNDIVQTLTEHHINYSVFE